MSTLDFNLRAAGNKRVQERTQEAQLNGRDLSIEEADRAFWEGVKCARFTPDPHRDFPPNPNSRRNFSP